MPQNTKESEYNRKTAEQQTNTPLPFAMVLLAAIILVWTILTISKKQLPSVSTLTIQTPKTALAAQPGYLRPGYIIQQIANSPAG